MVDGRCLAVFEIRVRVGLKVRTFKHVETFLPTPQSWYRRGGATAQSATYARLGWYRPSVGVPETLDGRASGVLV
eukprot:scaffold98808_cov69-Phaeocystis_antarctica.AAC.15